VCLCTMNAVKPIFIGQIKVDMEAPQDNPGSEQDGA
jgi:hypothetical protein